MLAAVIPVESGEAFERLASQPNLVQSWVPVRRCTGAAWALALSVDPPDDPAPQAHTANTQTILKIVCIVRKLCRAQIDHQRFKSA